MPEARPERRGLAQRVVELAGAATGSVFFFYFVGGLVTWRRFHTLGLSDEASVAALPRSGLLVTGLLAMRHPILLALVGILLYRILAPPGVRWRWRTSLLYRRRRSIALALMLAAVVVAAAFQAWDDVVLLSAVAALAVAAAQLAPAESESRGAATYVLVLGIGLAALALQYFHLARPPTHLEPAALVVDDRARPVVGYLVADTSGFVYVAPRAGPCEVGDEIAAYRRADVAEIRLSQRIKVWPAEHRLSGRDLRECRREETRAGF